MTRISHRESEGVGKDLKICGVFCLFVYGVFWVFLFVCFVFWLGKVGELGLSFSDLSGFHPNI